MGLPPNNLSIYRMKVYSVAAPEKQKQKKAG
jgi:hypothetical protein